jgi:hypothetical protein
VAGLLPNFPLGAPLPVVPSIAAVQLVHVATWIEAGTRELAAPSVKQRLAAIRHLFDWIVTGQVVRLTGWIGARAPARHDVRANGYARSGRSTRYSTASPRRPSAACAIAH